jgi:hypothetical protein
MSHQSIRGKYLEIIADKLSRAGWSRGCVSAIWIVDAHRGDGKRFVVRADESSTGFRGTLIGNPAGIGEIRAISGLIIFSFLEKIVLTASRGGLQDRAAPSCLGVSLRAPPDPLSAGQPVSEWLARTT